MDGTESRALAHRGSATLAQADYREPLPPIGEPATVSPVTRLRRHKVLLTTTFLLVIGGVAGAYFYLPRVYRAQADVIIEAPARVLPSQQAAGSELTIGDSSDIESQSLVLSSATSIRQLLDQPAIRDGLLRECEALRPPAWKKAIRDLLPLKPLKSCADSMQDTTSLVGNIASRLSVSTNGRSRVIDVAFNSPLPDVAQLVANAAVKTYLDDQTSAKLGPVDEAVDWLRKETTRVGDRLQTTDAQIDAFLHEHGVVRGQLAPIASEQLTSLSQQLALAQAEEASAMGRMQQSRSQGAATTGVLESRSVSDVKQQLATVEAQIAQDSARYGSANPAMRQLEGQRRGLVRLLGQETSLVTRSTQADYQAASSRVALLSSQVDALKKNVRGNDDAKTQVSALQRQATTDRELYLDLTKNLNQLETNRRLISANARLVAWAELPQSVFFPKLSTFALAGLMLSTALAIGVALLRDRADRTVRGVEPLHAAGLRILARIPHAARMGRSARQLERRMGLPSQLQEAIRALYAECLLVKPARGADGPLRSLMVASADAGEGKSFVSLALAHFASAAGLRVLVMECDLRRPSMGKTLALRPQPGLSEVLRGQLSPEEAIRRANSGRLDVILAGRPASDSVELLGSARMRQTLAWANTRYDLVIVDTPSCRSVPDARVLSPMIDGILCCARWGYSHTANTLATIDSLRAAGGTVLGIVLDRVEQQHYSLYEPSSTPAGSYMVLQGN